jgi:hypothetical protein
MRWLNKQDTLSYRVLCVFSFRTYAKLDIVGEIYELPLQTAPRMNLDLIVVVRS